MQVSAINVGTETWFALERAKALGFVVGQFESWSSDAEIAVPAGAKLIWEDNRAEGLMRSLVFEVESAVVSLVRERRTISLSLYGLNSDVNEELSGRFKKEFPPSERQSNMLDVTFWYHTQHGPRSYDRQLEAPSWEDIAANYPTSTRSKLDALRTVEPKDGSGKLVLWQGEPGTGKTFALRALAEEWAKWCKVHYVLDPEKFFSEGDYLLSVILGADLPQAPGQAASSMWRLIVLEDAGEMLAKDAKMQVGQGLARLLNLCDGLLGQGLRVLVLITTNEQIGTLHAAVSRPGRCLSQVNFDKFDAKEAGRWLEAKGGTAVAVKTATLAELFAAFNGDDEVKQQRKVAGF